MQGVNGAGVASAERGDGSAVEGRGGKRRLAGGGMVDARLAIPGGRRRAAWEVVLVRAPASSLAKLTHRPNPSILQSLDLRPAKQHPRPPPPFTDVPFVAAVFPRHPHPPRCQRTVRRAPRRLSLPPSLSLAQPLGSRQLTEGSRSPVRACGSTR